MADARVSVAFATACTLARACSAAAATEAVSRLGFADRLRHRTRGGLQRARRAGEMAGQLADLLLEPVHQRLQRLGVPRLGALLRRPLRRHAIGLDDPAPELLHRVGHHADLVAAPEADDNSIGIVLCQAAHRGAHGSNRLRQTADHQPSAA